MSSPSGWSWWESCSFRPWSRASPLLRRRSPDRCLTSEMTRGGGAVPASAASELHDGVAEEGECENRGDRKGESLQACASKSLYGRVQKVVTSHARDQSRNHELDDQQREESQ